MLKELGHYLTKEFTKGSKEEIASKAHTLEKPEKCIEKVLQPRYIIYDFETDTHTDIQT